MLIAIQHKGLKRGPFYYIKGPFPDNYRHHCHHEHRFMRGKAMNEVGGLGVRGLPVSPDSDCNSNHHGSASYLSNTSSQDIDFIQDNSDYQWFLDYGYRDGCTNHHTSILSLPESYEANDINYYDTLAKNMDANLAEADMESFRTEDIHALLTNLPPMCTDHLSQENNRQGESYASVSGSMMAKFDFDSSISPHSSSHAEDSANSASMSIYKSELLFSPVKEVPMPGANFSVDSLDCDMMLTCQANKDNYTIAFEGSVTMYSEDSDYHETDKSENSGSAHWPCTLKKHAQKLLDASMTQSDSGSLTTWSKLKKRNSDNQLRRHPSGNNNNNSADDSSHLCLSESSAKSQSMPNLYKQKLKTLLISNYLKSQSNNSSDACTVKRKPVKVFDIQHQVQSSSSGASISDMATSVDASSSENTANKPPNFSLVKLFMKQKSMSTEVMSTTMDQLSSTENWPASQSGESNSSDLNKPVLGDQASSSDQKLIELIAEEPEEEVAKSDPEKQFINVNNNNSYVLSESRRLLQDNKRKMSMNDQQTNRSIQTSQFSEVANLKNLHKQQQQQADKLVKIVEPSFLNKLKREGEIQKPVYVLYPNYVLPNLDFLNDNQQQENKVLLVPQEAPNLHASNKKRPFSCTDLEMLKKKGFAHVKDWESLNFLLPPEYRKILAGIPELSDKIKPTTNRKPSFARRRPMSCDYSSSSSSTATQPSSGYRGSSTILTDSQNSPAPNTANNPLFVYRYDSVTSSEASLLMGERNKSITTAPPLPVRCVSLQQGELPPRPPLPKSILRKGADSKEDNNQKRYSLYETSEEDLTEDRIYKRKSLHDPYYVLRNKRFSETEDEGVDAGTSSSSMDEHQESLRPSSPSLTTSNHLKSDFLLSNISTDELAQLEEFLKISGVSTSDHEDLLPEESLMQLRSYVGKFLALKINQDADGQFGGKKSVSFAEKVNVLPRYLDTKQLFSAPNNSPNVSAFGQQKNHHPKTLVDMPICEENEGSPNYSSPQTTPAHHKTAYNNLGNKRLLVNALTEAVEQLIAHFSSALNQSDLNHLGDSSSNPAIGKLALNTVCPALYAILSDGLKPSLESSFGAINNSVWQVVEASAQQGPLTKALNELVMRINSEDVITEGLVKFNAFVFGLLNVRSLDAWMSYLKTRESVLKKHYGQESLMVMAHTGGSNVRSLLDAVIAALQPLALLPFQLDLLFEYRQLHLSFKRMDSYQQQMSPTHKQWKSSGSGRSNSESEDNSATTVKHYPLESDLPDVLTSGSGSIAKIKSRHDNNSVKERPRSCVETKPNFKLGDLTTASKKRWSGIQTNSKLYLVYDKLAKEEEEEYTDSLEANQQNRQFDVCGEMHSDGSGENAPSLIEEAPESLDSILCDDKPINGRRFKKLQQKWEMLSGRESSQSPPLSPTSTPNKSKIPRLITSPSRPSGIPVLISPSSKAPKSRAAPVVKAPLKTNGVTSKTVKKQSIPTRTSRVDQLENGAQAVRHIQRPSSLPYKAANTQNKSQKVAPQRRAVSSSLSRRPMTKQSVPKVVRTLSHRIPSESGHLSYNEGEKLKVVLEVDDKWLLCCRGNQKGLVPKSSVISADVGRF